LLNRAPTKSLKDQTSYEAWFGRKPGVKHLRTFGCKAYVKRVGPGISKLSNRSTPGVLLGYEPGTQIYDPVQDKLMISRDVIFDEKVAWNWEGTAAGSPAGGVAVLPETFQVQCFEDTVHSPTTGADADDGPVSEWEPASPAASIPTTGGAESPHTSPHQQIQWATPPTHDSDFSEDAPLRYRTIPDLLETTEAMQDLQYSGVCLVAAQEPMSIEEVLSEQSWRKAMEKEMKAIHENQTWVSWDLPPKQKAIGLKCVFKVNKDPEGNIVKHKARLVAKGYAQRQGIDFDEVFAPIARIETVRVLLALAAHGSWEVHHMDVKSAFLNGDLTEMVFVQQPPGFIIGDSDKVLKLKKVLYGLRGTSGMECQA